MIHKQVAAEPRVEADGTVWFVASTESVDRDGDVIRQDGWVLDSFITNPVILFSHDSGAPPVGRAVEVGVRSGQLMVRVEFAPESVSAGAAEIGRLVAAGFLRAVSVGFQPLDYAPLASGGVEYLRSELLEISVCSIPANRDTLVVGRSAITRGREVESWVRRGGRPGADLHAPLLVVRDDDAAVVVRDDGDDVVVFDPADFAVAFLEAAAQDLAEIIRHETALAIARARGRLDDPLLGDRVRHQHIAGGDADLTDVHRALATEVPALVMEALRSLGPVVRDEAARAIRQTRGRLD